MSDGFRDESGIVCMHPNDGWYPTEQVNPVLRDRVWMGLELRSGNQCIQAVPIVERPTTPAAISRERLFLAAIARYLNTGGQIPNGNLAYIMPLELPEGYTLCDTYHDGVFVHCFEKPDSDVGLVWVEGESVYEQVLENRKQGD